MSKGFNIKEKNAKIHTEVIAGLTTFFTMAYVLFLVPQTIAGGDTALYNGVYTATCIAAFAGTLLMGLLANLPLAVAPSMALVAYFSTTIMGKEGYSYPAALAVVFIAGLLYIIISVCGLKVAINKALPKNLKIAISAGIGLFIATLGLEAGNVFNDGSMFNVSAIFQKNGNSYTALMLLLGVLIMGLFARLHIPGGILFGIIGTSVIYWLVSLATGMDTLPAISYSIGDIGTQFGNWLTNSFGSMFTKGFAELFSGKESFVDGLLAVGIMVLSYTFIDIFSTTGTILGTATKGELLDEEGNLPEMQKAFIADSTATGISAILGAPGAGVSVESCAGVAEKGKTGLASVITAACFIIALFAAPFGAFIPSPVYGAALVFVGMMMMSAIKDFDWSDPTDALPAFICILAMPLTGSIADGIFLGVIMHVLLKLITLRFTGLSIVETILAIIFILKYLFLK